MGNIILLRGSEGLNHDIFEVGGQNLLKVIGGARLRPYSCYGNLHPLFRDNVSFNYNFV
jgi:hypothetical protein